MRVYQEPVQDQLRKKLVVVGDGACGKTALLMVQSGQAFPEDYVPTIFENYISNVNVQKDKTVQLSLWDTAGQEDYDRLRPLSYPDTDVAILAFSICNPHSYENIREKWDPETKHFLPGVPRLVVGTKKDLRNDHSTVEELQNNGLKPISQEQGQLIANQIGASKYLECSAKTGEGVAEVFVAAAKLAMNPRRKFKQQCLLF
ncbi:P-loop containing nucleoside triphosphate hydrolase protein [Gorgonomyces haynaldii]|nr:P-loop containing nucleoside triphosphate hydrolase protein [Gorgonomyces haynaldii]